MKLGKHTLVLLLLKIALFMSCTTNVEVDEPPVIMEEVDTTIEPDLVQKLIGTHGVLRGVSFGMTEDRVRGIELAKHDETALDTNGVLMVRFVDEIDLETSVDIEYYFSGEKKQLSRIGMFVYCSDSTKQKEVFNKLSASQKTYEGVEYTIKKVGNEDNPNVELLVERVYK